MNKKVARMGIGMKEAVIKNLLEVTFEKTIGNLGPVDSGGFKTGVVGYFNRLHVLKGQHSPGGVALNHLRDPDIRPVSEIFGEGGGILCFVDIIDLFVEGLAELSQ